MYTIARVGKVLGPSYSCMRSNAQVGSLPLGCSKYQEGAPVKTPTSTIFLAAVSFTSICSRGMLAGGEHIPAPWCFIVTCITGYQRGGSSCRYTVLLQDDAPRSCAQHLQAAAL